ncbi:hypothetical protein BDV24DRAFT_82886 [Aspergillus arachidicola]|uniref:Uncharacterized protein n=1 Tax=Aspergillus arachidicola TaxID=656916 RepID=A0A5N6Y3D6_9EURO|nr:hypothetical protein BDV24DRAFT_82886 [Aspergillus arachidicola]
MRRDAVNLAKIMASLIEYSLQCVDVLCNSVRSHNEAKIIFFCLLLVFSSIHTRIIEKHYRILERIRMNNLWSWERSSARRTTEASIKWKLQQILPSKTCPDSRILETSHD